ncbi:hypothetical protein FRC02_000003 [Tulasnella sp. 418]|nr:hypothetical protein FRC02_000003 [Tulasnella sp. 418]
MSNESSGIPKFKTKLPSPKPVTNPVKSPAGATPSTLRKTGSLSSINRQSNLKPTTASPTPLRTTRSVISNPSSSTSSLPFFSSNVERASAQSLVTSVQTKRRVVPSGSPSSHVKKPSPRAAVHVSKSNAEGDNMRNDTVRPSSSTRESLKTLIARKRQALQQSANTSNGSGDINEAEHFESSFSGDDSGRRSLKDTIERARTSGTLNISSRSLSILPINLFTIHLGIEPECSPSGQQDIHPEDKVPSTILPYYQVVDLVTLKARNNIISSIQPELSLFGSLKFLDFHNNTLNTLPNSFGDLLQLGHLDLSSNQFESFPVQLLGLPSLSFLNLSSNKLSNLRLSSPLPTEDSNPFYSSTSQSDDIFPALQTLLVSCNQLKSSSIDPVFPRNLVKLDLSDNPLSVVGFGALLASLGNLKYLKELNLQRSELEDVGFSDQSIIGRSLFRQLEVLDVRGNPWIRGKSMHAYFHSAKIGIGQQDGGDNHVLGGVCIKTDDMDSSPQSPTLAKDIAKPISNLGDVVEYEERTMSPLPQEPQTKGTGEEEEPSGNSATHAEPQSTLGQISTKPSNPIPLDKYYDSRLLALTLPPLKPSAHHRSTSLLIRPLPSNIHDGATDPHLPRETVPLGLIESQTWATNLRALYLVNRRADVLVTLNSGLTSLPRLEELDLRGSGLHDRVRVQVDQDAEGRESLLDVIYSHCPSLKILDLSENQLTELPGISRFFLPDPLSSREPLKVLRVRGNAISNLEGLVELAERFGRGDVDRWSGEEIDIRDNQVSKLPPVLGLLQLGVLLVEGNRFRVPQRSVWLKEGTKGLLRFLRESG